MTVQDREIIIKGVTALEGILEMLIKQRADEEPLIRTHIEQFRKDISDKIAKQLHDIK